MSGTLTMVIITETVIGIHSANRSGRFFQIPILTATTILIQILIIQHLHEAIRLLQIVIATVHQRLREAVVAVAGVAVEAAEVGQAGHPDK